MTDILDLLKGGYAKFRAGDFHEQKELYEELGTKGQKPRVMILSCSDSRVDPSDIFHAYPGEMFVVRNVAATIPPNQTDDGFHGTASAIEYGVKGLGVEAIVVMGHESCGGCAGALHGLGDLDAGYVREWVKILSDVAEEVRDAPEPERAMEKAAVKHTIANLMTYPWIKEKVEAGELKLIGMWFSIIAAKLLLLGDDGEFDEVPTGVSEKV